jgi:hypothetical protein
VTTPSHVLPGDREPSEAALFAARLLADTMSQTDLLELERMLAHSLSHPRPSLLREARLGLLIEMCDEQTGEVPDVDRYEQERRRRLETDESWPVATTIARAFFGWYQACRAAMRLKVMGAASRESHSQTHRTGLRREYTRQEVTATLARFHDERGRWPNFSEFWRWGQDLRQHARRNGLPDPRIPSMPVVARAFGSFDRALSVAQKSSDGSRPSERKAIANAPG